MIETHDIVILGTIIAISNGLVVLGDRLWKRKPEERPDQSIACNFQHASFQRSLDSQNESLKELVDSLRTMVQAAELRHQIVCDKLDRLYENINHRHETRA